MNPIRAVCAVLLLATVATAAPPTEAEKERERVRVAIEIARARLHPEPAVTPPAKPAPTDSQRYAYLVQGVEDGRAQVMIVGPHESLHEYIHQERFPSGFMGFADGVYDCFPRDEANGKRTAVMKLREEVSPKANPFQSHTTPRTFANSAGYLNTGRADAAPFQGHTFTPAPTATLGFTTTVRCVGYR